MRWLQALVTVGIACATAWGAAPLTWRWSNPTPHGATVYDMVYRNGLLVQACEAGQIFTTTDLAEWRPRATGVTNSLRGLAWFGDRLIVSAAAGKILWTDDLRQYNIVNLATADWLEAVAASAQRVVTVGDNGSIYHSTDGVAWQRAATQPQWLRSVAYGRNKFVAVGEAGFITVSLDGQTWGAAASPTTANLNRVVYIDDRFWIVGDGGVVLTNTPRNTWEPLATGTTVDLFGVAGRPQEMVLVGREQIRSSPPPFTVWTTQTGAAPAPPPWTYYSALWIDDQFVASGRSGIFVGGSPTNGAPTSTWSAYYDPPRNWMWSLVRVPELYVATGDKGGIFTSTDGFRFDQEFVPNSATNEVLMGLGGSDDLLISVGTAGTILVSTNIFTNVVTTTPDGQQVTQRVSLLGINWEEVVPRPTTANLSGVGKFGATYLAVGAGGTILGSGNGYNWTPRASGVSQTLSSVADSNTRVVVVGDVGALVTSDNGILWTPRSSGTQNWITQVRHLNGQFISVGETGLILTSPDGVAWTPRTSGTAVWLNDITFAGGTYYVAGSHGVVLRSPDAVAWEVLRLPTTKSFYGVAGFQGQIVVAGLEGAILRARATTLREPIDIIAYGRAGDASVFAVNGIIDQMFHFEWRDNWGAWQRGEPLEILDNSGLSYFYMPEPPENPFRIYRTILAE